MLPTKVPPTNTFTMLPANAGANTRTFKRWSTLPAASVFVVNVAAPEAPGPVKVAWNAVGTMRPFAWTLAIIPNTKRSATTHATPHIRLVRIRLFLSISLSLYLYACCHWFCLYVLFVAPVCVGADWHAIPTLRRLPYESAQKDHGLGPATNTLPWCEQWVRVLSSCVFPCFLRC